LRTFPFYPHNYSFIIIFFVFTENSFSSVEQHLSTKKLSFVMLNYSQTSEKFPLLCSDTIQTRLTFDENEVKKIMWNERKHWRNISETLKILRERVSIFTLFNVDCFQCFQCFTQMSYNFSAFLLINENLRHMHFIRNQFFRKNCLNFTFIRKVYTLFLKYPVGPSVHTLAHYKFCLIFLILILLKTARRNIINILIISVVKINLVLII
jgi:hypothetical protein